MAQVLKAGGGVRFHRLGGSIQNILVSEFGTLEHVDTISALLFSMVAGFAVAITIFSVRQTSYRRVPHYKLRSKMLLTDIKVRVYPSF